MKIVKERNLLKSPAASGSKREWTDWELWHHEGRRARHGAAMMGPDYTWWHGIYDVAQHFYFKMLPEARKFNDPELNAYLDELIKDNPMHAWLTTPTGELKESIHSGKLQRVYEGLFKQQ